jgi:hypothetical protein
MYDPMSHHSPTGRFALVSVVIRGRDERMSELRMVCTQEEEVNRENGPEEKTAA